ncbi:hypothetical protein GCM10011415_28630 [Salipiger pallidus]|uniref:PRC-barrel domain-containing protein n=1 Tax=Salipiger pallidus TaxID=1775170 RepID=A0A8J3EHF5_9RHOB|nr:PRC-barrel domain-containing protein [Salipiger pallidus]GGG77958.1 hypothetical protein GCM10011415_28630 [Salipiger pallidus]
MQSLSELLNWHVRLAEGDAALSDILFDPKSRRISYFVVRHAGGDGSHTLAAASYLGTIDTDAREIELMISTEELTRAPRWEPGAPGFDPGLAALPPLVIGPFGATHAPLLMPGTDEDARPVPEDARAEKALENYQRLSRWIERPVFASDGEIGKLGDITGDLQENRLDWLVIDNGKFFGRERRVLPFSALAHRAPGDKGGHLVLDVTTAEYEEAPTLEDHTQPAA